MPKTHAVAHKNKSKKTKHAHSKHKSHRYADDNDDVDDSNIDADNVDYFDPVDDEYSQEEEEEYQEEDEVKPQIVLDAKTKERLKRKITEWLDYDDKIKDLNARTKKYKEAKKNEEEIIIKMITKLGMADNKIDIHDNNDNLRSRVYRHKSVTRGALKEDIIKDALMEAIRDEKKVDQLVKKIENKRPVNERYYLKRTKGNK